MLFFRLSILSGLVTCTLFLRYLDRKESEDDKCGDLAGHYRASLRAIHLFGKFRLDTLLQVKHSGGSWQGTNNLIPIYFTCHIPIKSGSIQWLPMEPAQRLIF